MIEVLIVAEVEHLKLAFRGVEVSNTTLVPTVIPLPEHFDHIADSHVFDGDINERVGYGILSGTLHFFLLSL